MLESAGIVIDETLNPNECYYDHLDPQHNYTIYAIPGGGYMNFMTVLSTINLTKFDSCIIQETFDPRMFFHTQPEYQTYKRNNIELNVGDYEKVKPGVVKSHRKLDHRYMVGETFDHKLMPNALGEPELKWMERHIVKSFVTQCNHLLEKANIPTVAFAFTRDKDWGHTWIKYLDIQPIQDIYFFKKKYHNFKAKFLHEDWFGHFTEEGNKELGKLLRNVL